MPYSRRSPGTQSTGVVKSRFDIGGDNQYMYSVRGQSGHRGYSKVWDFPHLFFSHRTFSLPLEPFAYFPVAASVCGAISTANAPNDGVPVFWLLFFAGVGFLF